MPHQDQVDSALSDELRERANERGRPSNPGEPRADPPGGPSSNMVENRAARRIDEYNADQVEVNEDYSLEMREAISNLISTATVQTDGLGRTVTTDQNVWEEVINRLNRYDSHWQSVIT